MGISPVVHQSVKAANVLVEKALAQNQDIDVASARLREARANRDAIRGRDNPQAAVTSAATSNRVSANGMLPIGKIPGFDSTFSLLEAGFDASWEIDPWGGIKRAVEGAEARIQIAEERRRSVAIQVIAELVRSYVDLRMTQSLKTTVLDDAEAQDQIGRIVAERMNASR